MPKEGPCTISVYSLLLSPETWKVPGRGILLKDEVDGVYSWNLSHFDEEEIHVKDQPGSRHSCTLSELESVSY